MTNYNNKILISLIGVWLLVHLPVLAQNAPPIQLKNCVKLCLVFYADHSGSMDNAKNDICRWSRATAFIPGRDGSVCVGLYSFELGYHCWRLPTSNRSELIASADTMCRRGTGSHTQMSPGLYAIRNMLAQRRMEFPDEHQVVLVQSDYFLDDYHETRIGMELLIREGVLVLLSVPSKYELVEPPGSYNDNLNEVELSLYQSLGAQSVRSSYELFASYLAQLSPKSPCN